MAVTRSGSSYALYVDGAQVATDISPYSIPDPVGPLTIGRAEGFFLNGLVDEVEIFDRALSSSEIQALFDAGSAGKCKVTTVTIDIKPGSDRNRVNPRSHGRVRVAILTTETFDASTVDPSTVQFGPNGATSVRSRLKDVDGDGDLDLVLRFRVRDTGIACGDTSASLTGETTGGQAIEGSDAIKTVGCKKDKDEEEDEDEDD